jgi:hypothetical protein
MPTAFWHCSSARSTPPARLCPRCVRRPQRAAIARLSGLQHGVARIATCAEAGHPPQDGIEYGSEVSYKEETSGKVGCERGTALAAEDGTPCIDISAAFPLREI